MNTSKKEQKQNLKKLHHGMPQPSQRHPNTKSPNHTKTTTVMAHGLLTTNSLNKIENNPVTKPASTKLNRNQVSANWTNVAGALKTQRSIPPTKKMGKWMTPDLLFCIFFLHFG